MGLSAAAIVGIVSVVLGTLGELNNVVGTEISAKNADAISAVYDKALDYYNRLQNGYNVKISELNNLINDLRSAQMGMTGTPRALVSAAIERATRKVNAATAKSGDVANAINKVTNEKILKTQNEAAHSQTALFRKRRDAGNVAEDLMSDEAKQGLIHQADGTDITKAVNNSLINAGVGSGSSSNQTNQNGGKQNV